MASLKGVTLLLIPLFAGLSSVIGSNPSYLLMVPSAMSPGRPFTISVNLFEARKDVTIKAEILNSTNGTILSTVEMFHNKSQFTVTLQIPSGLENSHVVRVHGSGDITFNNQTTVTVNTDSMIIMIQTDKAIYKPGQTVKFRCLAVYPDLKPYLGTFDVSIFDSGSNKVFQKTTVKGKSGVYGDELPLASAPPLGNWRIQCSVNSGERSTKYVEIKEYVLPKVEVKIELPPFFHESRMPYIATVSAMYTYGKPVEGTVQVSLNFPSYRYNKNHQRLVRTANLVNGKKDMKYEKEDFEFIYVCDYSESYCNSTSIYDMLRYSSLELQAVITDNVTDKQYTAKERFSLDNLFRMKFLEITPKTFKGGLDWKGYLQLTLPDGSAPLLTDTDGKILNITYEYRGREVKGDNSEVSFQRKEFEQHQFPEGGILELKTTIPNDVSACRIRAFYPGVSESLRIERYNAKDQQTLQLSIPDLKGSIKPGDDVKFVLKSRDPVDHYHYQLISKGQIVKHGEGVASGTANEFTITFDKDLAQKTAPSARIVVWHMTAGTGEIIVDNVEFNVDGAFANKVALTFNKDKVEPAEDVDVVVTAHPNSYVGLVAVDQSVTLLKKGNDITKDMVLNELRGFTSGSGSFSPYSCCFCFYPRSLGGKDAKEVFSNAGVKVMTDGYVHDAGYVDHGCYDEHNYRSYGQTMDRQSYGAVEMDSPPSGSALTTADPVRVREKFPETWIWTDDVTDNDGQVTISAKAPDTITSWVASAFAVNEEVGLGITDDTSKLTVFQAFFAHIDMPISAIRGEHLQLKVVVFNYLKSAQQVKVTLKKPENSEFHAWNDGEKNLNVSQDIVKNIQMNANDGVELKFWISPQKVGQIPVEVKAQSQQAADALRRKLTVEPEGVPQTYIKNFYIGVNNTNSFEEGVDVTFPSDVIADSQSVTFSATGDIMGPTMRNLDRLLRMPYGCAEQNMLNFAPNIFVLEYLNATKQLDSDIAKKAKLFMNKGYQNQLKFRRYDGSYSAFGYRDTVGSTWLTAFVIRTFQRARPYISIQQNMIKKAMKFLMKQQEVDGSFSEPSRGRVIHSELQGSSLTAYVLITLIELRDAVPNDKNFTRDVEDSIIRAFIDIERRLLFLSKSVYPLSLITYAFNLYGHPKADEVFTMFNNLSKTDDSRGVMFWKKPYEVEIIDGYWRPPYRVESSNSIEMTSYGLFTYLLRNDLEGAGSIIKWLSLQRNALGGYRSSQDTVVATDALAKFASRVIPTGEQRVDVLVEDVQKYVFDTITKNNVDVLQQFEVDTISTSMRLKASGNGAALVQMKVSYNQKQSVQNSGFNMTITSRYVSPGQLSTKICFRYSAPKEVLESTGMVVVEMDQLTGHVPVTTSLLSDYQLLGLKKWEFVRQKKLVLYFDQVYEHVDTCVTILSGMYQRVEHLKPALCKIYSYYKTELSDTQLYIAQ